MEEARERFEDNSQLGRTYKEKRNQLLDLKFKREAMNLALDRDELIFKGAGAKAALLSRYCHAAEAARDSP